MYALRWVDVWETMNWKTAYNKIIRAKGYKIRFVHLKTAYADIDDKTNEIRIDLNNVVPPARKFGHELLHYCFPGMPHTEVYRLESEIWNESTQKQKLKLYKKLFQ